MKKNGFTLVEIMIVVVIVGLLGAMAVPAFIMARNRSQASVAANHLKKIGDEFNVILLERGVIPTGIYNESNNGSVPGGFDADDVKVVMEHPLGDSFAFSYDFGSAFSAPGEGKAIMTRLGAPLDDDMLVEIDKIIDDGNTSTGLAQRQNDNQYWFLSYQASNGS